MTNEYSSENGSLDYLTEDLDLCPVCDRHERECTCPAEDAAPVANASGYATLEEAKAAGPQGSQIRRNAIRVYLIGQREAKRAARQAHIIQIKARANARRAKRAAKAS